MRRPQALMTEKKGNREEIEKQLLGPPGSCPNFHNLALKQALISLILGKGTQVILEKVYFSW
jgi:hypothetical protein